MRRNMVSTSTEDGLDWAVAENEARRVHRAPERHLREPTSRKSRVDLIRGWARFIDAHTVEVAGRKLHGRQIVIATGGRPLLPDIPGMELGMTSDGFFELEAQPERVAIVGSGYVAVELAASLPRWGRRPRWSSAARRCMKSFDAMIGAATVQSLREARREIRHRRLAQGAGAHGGRFIWKSSLA